MSKDKKKYRVVRRHMRIKGEEIPVGEVVELTATEAANRANKVELYSGAVKAAGDSKEVAKLKAELEKANAANADLNSQLEAATAPPQVKKDA